jgi:hypothetical protein
VAAAIGLVAAFHPMLATGLARMQGDTGDTRLNNYILEHGYRAIVLNEPGRTLWSPPFFFPVPNVLAYSETLLSTLPLYAPWRVIGIAPDTAFQLWWMGLTLLNYAAAFLFLRRCCNCSPLASAGGAFLFAFGGPRISQTGHQQLFAHFFSVICLFALVQWLRQPWKRWIAIFFAAYAAQFYASFYLWWFLTIALGIAALIALVRRDDVWRQPMSWAAGLLVAALLVLPGAMHYAAARAEIGYAPADFVFSLLPRVYSWIYMGPHNWLYRWQAHMEPFQSLSMDQEHRLGLGLITTALVLAGLYLERRRPVVRVMLPVAAILVAAVTVWPNGFSLWPILAPWMPAGGAVRAPGRVMLLLLIPVSAGFAFTLDRLRNRGAIVALAVCIFEQVSSTPSYDKLEVRRHVEAVAAAVPKNCRAFLYTPVRTIPMPPDMRLNRSIKNQIDAMWAQFDAGIPTWNGYSGYAPPHWPLSDITIYTNAGRTRLAEQLATWAGADSCRVEIPAPDEGWRAGNLAGHLKRRLSPEPTGGTE